MKKNKEFYIGLIAITILIILLIASFVQAADLKVIKTTDFKVIKKEIEVDLDYKKFADKECGLLSKNQGCVVEKEISSKDIDYKEKREIKLISYNTRNNYIFTQETVCGKINKTCYNVSNMILNNTYRINKWEVKPVHSIESQGKNYYYDKHNGFVCGIYLVQVSRDDGGQFLENIDKSKICDGTNPIIPSGWDCYKITNLRNSQEINTKWGGFCEK
jgi:hypothetical protein